MLVTWMTMVTLNLLGGKQTELGDELLMGKGGKESRMTPWTVGWSTGCLMSFSETEKWRRTMSRKDS